MKQPLKETGLQETWEQPMKHDRAPTKDKQDKHDHMTSPCLG